MALGALLVTAGVVGFYVRSSTALEGKLYLMGGFGVIVFAVGLLIVIRGR